MSCRVLLVSREHEQVVGARERHAGSRGFEVVVGEEIHVLVRPVQPRDELEIPIVEAKGNAEIEERTFQVDGAISSRDVPRISPTVPVCVPEVVGGPRVRSEDDRDAVFAEPSRVHDERRVADASVVRLRAYEVQTARPVARAHHAQERGRVAMTGPIDRNRTRLCRSGCLHVLLTRRSRRLVRKHLQPKRPCVGGEAKLRLLTRGVAAPRKCRVDSLNTDHGSVLPSSRSVRAVHARLPAASPDGETEDVGARFRRAHRPPGERP